MNSKLEFQYIFSIDVSNEVIRGDVVDEDEETEDGMVVNPATDAEPELIDPDLNVDDVVLDEEDEALIDEILTGKLNASFFNITNTSASIVEDDHGDNEGIDKEI